MTAGSEDVLAPAPPALAAVSAVLAASAHSIVLLPTVLVLICLSLSCLPDRRARARRRFAL